MRRSVASSSTGEWDFSVVPMVTKGELRACVLAPGGSLPPNEKRESGRSSVARTNDGGAALVLVTPSRYPWILPPLAGIGVLLRRLALRVEHRRLFDIYVVRGEGIERESKLPPVAKVVGERHLMGTKKLGNVEPNVRTGGDDNAEVMIFSAATLHLVATLIPAA